VSYAEDDWSVALQHQYIGEARKAACDVAIAGCNQNFVIPYLPSMSVFDLTVSKSFEFMGGESELYFNVSNLTDERAPLLPGNSGIPGLFYPTAGFHDDMGRFYTIGLRGKF
jgi:outer membrane receptor protein involved in Fe transport